MNESSSQESTYRYRKFQHFVYLGELVHLVHYPPGGMPGAAACGARTPWFIWPHEPVSGALEVGPQCEECWANVYGTGDLVGAVRGLADVQGPCFLSCSCGELFDYGPDPDSTIAAASQFQKHHRMQGHPLVLSLIPTK